MSDVRRIMEATLFGESFFGDMLNKLKNYFNQFINALKNIPFGGSKKIVIKIPNKLTEAINEAKGVYTYGEYVEVLTVYKIEQMFISENISSVKMITNVNQATLDKVKNKGIKEEDIIRGDESATLIASAIYQEIRGMEDFLFMTEISVFRTGVPGVRADLTINVSKGDTKQIVKVLQYSIKSMASKTFTTYSSTGGAFLKLFVDFSGLSRKEWLELVKQKMGTDQLIIDLYKYLKAAAEAKKQNNEDDLGIYRDEISNLMANIITKYGKDPTFISNFLQACGLNYNHAENIYLAVGEAKNVKLYSSKTSDNFKNLLEKMKEGVYITAEHRGNEAGFVINIINNLGAKIDIPFRGGWGVTSSKSGIPKLNILGSAESFT